MNEEERRKIISDEYLEGIVEYSISSEEVGRFAAETLNIINDKYAVVYVPISTAPNKLIGAIGYSVVPKLYTILDNISLEQMGVVQLQKIPV